MKYNLYGDYWYFNGALNPYPVRIVDFSPLREIRGVFMVMNRKGRKFTAIKSYLFRNHEIQAIVREHATDLMQWADDNHIDQHNGLSHKPDQVQLNEKP